ncbi:MAG: hypothetical protein WCS71_06250 [Sphaerochaetaceae bacterium]|jgi:hypothetical protein
MKVRITRHRNLVFLRASLVTAMIAFAFFAVWVVTRAAWACGVWCIPAIVVVIGTIVELAAVRIIHPTRPEARVLTDEEQLRSIRGDGYTKGEKS